MSRPRAARILDLVCSARDESKICSRSESHFLVLRSGAIHRRFTIVYPACPFPLASPSWRMRSPTPACGELATPPARRADLKAAGGDWPYSHGRANGAASSPRQ